MIYYLCSPNKTKTTSFFHASTSLSQSNKFIWIFQEQVLCRSWLLGKEYEERWGFRVSRKDVFGTWKILYAHLISWCNNFVERHSFLTVLGNPPETMWKLCLSTRFSHQEIWWNYGIFCNATNISGDVFLQNNFFKKAST